MTRSERFVAGVFVAASLLALGACNKKEPVTSTSAVEDPAAMLARENREIAERLAQQKAELEGKNAQARVELDVQRTKEQRQKNLASYQEQRAKWAAPYGEAGRTAREEIGQVIAKMEAVKAEVQSVKVDECTDKALATLASAMGQAIDAYKEFQRETGQPSEGVRKKLTGSNFEIDKANAEAQACAQ
jgi:vacuolar-type H+-ATPase subunit I/STV1